MARKSEFFRCPKCRSRIQKTAQAWVMGEVSRGIMMGDCKPTYCPFCGQEMDTLAIIDGKYDDKPAGILGCLLFAAAMGGVYWWLHYEQDFSEISAGCLALLIVVVGAFALAGVLRLFSKSRGK
ncbi:MAG: hypothetical protein HZA50_08475 [Planctomycetes bacterium]|nr:hypothetical protein [Planctomycetota bacterium]